ncbi:MAG: type III-A CRISPR-associated protein Csm2 [Saprospiraceae bacterium]|nr:type III-A CRISPR-associated protein Csm2 [Candidatus Vicinibacter affinis]
MSNNTNPLLEQYFPKKSFKDLLSIGPDSAPESVREAIGCIEQMMREQARNITYTQLRNILQEVKKDEFKGKLSKFYLVIPKLADMEARLQKEKCRKVIAFIREMASELNTSTEYEAFKEIMNALVAYHKLHGQNTN